MIPKYLQILIDEDSVDSYGYITDRLSRSPEQDGGDTTQREGMFLVLSYAAWKEKKISDQDWQYIHDRYVDRIKGLKCSNKHGNYKRHPNTAKWYGQCDRMSRDQWTCNAIAFGWIKNSFKLKADMLLGHGLRGFLFTTNTAPNHKMPGDEGYKWKMPDLTILSVWNFYLRWNNFGWLVYPLVLLLDVDLLLGSLFWLFKLKVSNKIDVNDTSKPEWLRKIKAKLFHRNFDSDILNHSAALLQAKYNVPTPLSWLARKILPIEDVLYCFWRYCQYNNSDDPSLDVIAEDMLRDAWK